MEYYELLGLEREPFADTANPYFLYASADHEDCLARLEMAVRMGRGLSLVLGDVGTGKTTMALSLEEHLTKDSRFCVGTIYDPAFLTEEELLEGIFVIFGVEVDGDATLAHKLEAFHHFLLTQLEERGRSVVLIMDEGQKISPANLELLRLLLNNQQLERRLFNIVIFGQLELLPAISQNTALKDRINLLYAIRPLGRDATMALIEHRLERAGAPAQSELFTEEAKLAIFEASGGHPRKIILLCQEAIQESFVHDSGKVDKAVIDTVITRRNEVEQFIAGYLEQHPASASWFDPQEHAYVPLPSPSPAAIPVLPTTDPQLAEDSDLPIAEPSFERPSAADPLTPPAPAPLEPVAVAIKASAPTLALPAAVEPAADLQLPARPVPPVRRGFWQWLFGN